MRLLIVMISVLYASSMYMYESTIGGSEWKATFRSAEKNNFGQYTHSTKCVFNSLTKQI